MSRNRSTNERISPTQRKAIIVIICCLLAIVLTFVCAWILPSHISFGSSGYDPELYPLDTSLGAILPNTGDGGPEYIQNTVFVGDEYTVSLANSNQVTLNQYVGTAGLSTSNILNNYCVFFADDPNSYTVPQALSMMKPRRVVVTLGSNDVMDSMGADSFVQNYKQALKAITTAYPYCDVIVNAVPPVAKPAERSAERQTLIDEYNQKLALACEEMGFKFLNSSEVLKNNIGMGEDTYFDASKNIFTSAGVNLFLNYVKTHVYSTEDRRPDTDNIPQRAASAAGQTAGSDMPTATPAKYMAMYSVESLSKGSLTGNGMTGVDSIVIEADPMATISVTAVPADGFTFYKWSDGQTSATRYDNVNQNISVTAMFNDARVELTLDRGDTTLQVGEKVSINASVTLGGKAYDNSNVQWAVNGDLEGNMGTYTFDAAQPGDYTVKAGIEINGTYASKEIKITVPEPVVQTTMEKIEYEGSLVAGSAIKLSVIVNNGVGDTVWSCDNEPGWSYIGNTAPYTFGEAGNYTFHVKNNGAETSITMPVSAPAVEPPAQQDPTTQGETTE